MKISIHNSLHFAFLLCLTALLGCGDVKSDNFDVIPEINKLEITPKKTFGIVITAFNRPQFLSRTFESLKESNLSDAIVVVVDDASTDLETISLIKNLELPGVPLVKLRHTKNSGVLSGLMHGFKFLTGNAKYVLNIDSDVIMKADWLESLRNAYEQIKDPNIIFTGFNTKNHKIGACDSQWCEKKTLGGINLFMTASFYETQFLSWFKTRDRLVRHVWKNWDWIVVEKMREAGYKMYATKPSVIQHIGEDGINSAPGSMDTAYDF